MQLTTGLYNTVNAGWIDVKKDISEQHFGKIELHDVFATILMTYVRSR